MSMYSRRFYATRKNGSSASAEVVVPLLLSQFKARSVVDIGCGIGLWLDAFQRQGVTDVFGVDGPHVPRDMLRIPQDRFLGADLKTLWALPRQFDVACSLEVAEHLPHESAEDFVGLLTNAAPIVLFSAAVPHQGGTGHVNEQWQFYWSRLFAKRGYLTLDCIRPHLIGDARVDWWYRQNILVYCAPTHLPRGRVAVSGPCQINYIDPEMADLLAQARSTPMKQAAHAVRRRAAAFGRMLLPRPA
jgi:hypothetical protein